MEVSGPTRDECGLARSGPARRLPEGAHRPLVPACRPVASPVPVARSLACRPIRRDRGLRGDDPLMRSSTQIRVLCPRHESIGPERCLGGVRFNQRLATMIKALAPRMPGGARGCGFRSCWRGSWPVTRPAVGAQPRKDAPPRPRRPPRLAKPGEEPDAEDADEKAAARREAECPTVEIFKRSRTPRRRWRTRSRAVPGKRARPTATPSRSRRWPRARSPSTATTIERFVEGMANELTDKTNIKALIDPPAGINAERRGHACHPGGDRQPDRRCCSRPGRRTTTAS